MILANKSREIFRWVFNDDSSLKYGYTIPITEPKAKVNKIFCSNNGYHTIITVEGKENYFAFYLNSRSNKIRELFKVKDQNILIECVGWDERCNEFSTNVTTYFNIILLQPILLGTDKGSIHSLQIDYDLKSDNIKEKLSLLLALKNGNIYGIGVYVLIIHLV